MSQVIGKKLRLMNVPTATEQEQGTAQQLVITPEGRVRKKIMLAGGTPVDSRPYRVYTGIAYLNVEDFHQPFLVEFENTVGSFTIVKPISSLFRYAITCNELLNQRTCIFINGNGQNWFASANAIDNSTIELELRAINEMQGIVYDGFIPVTIEIRVYN